MRLWFWATAHLVIMMEHQYLILELRRPETEERLRDALSASQSRCKALSKEVDRLAMMYGAEVSFNSQLCDLLRLHGIPFHHVFDHSVRYKNTMPPPKL